MTKLIVVFRKFANSPNNDYMSIYVISQLVFIAEAECVYRAVQTEALNKIQADRNL
jgi:hypothetical protein